MKTRAQQLGITEFPYREFDDRGNQIYRERSNGRWAKYGYDERDNEIYFESCYNWWGKTKYDEHGSETYAEWSDGNKTYIIR